MAETVTSLPPAGLIALRGRPDDRAFLDAVAGVLGAAPPVEPNTAVLGPPAIHWLQPTSWLVVASPEGVEGLAARLREAVGASGAVVDVSDARVGYAVAGPDAVRLLSKGCGLDLHPRVFPAGRSALTAFAQLHTLIVKRDEAPTFHLYVARSVQRHLEAWFQAAGA